MAISGFLWLLAATNISLLAWSFSWQSKHSWRQWFLRAMLAGMIYDNLLVSMAPWWLDQEVYETANIVRFLTHASVLPFLVLFALSIMDSSGAALARKNGWRVFCFGFVAVAVVYGLWREVWLLELGPKTALEFTRLSSTDSLPPLATIFANLLVLPMAFIVGRTAGWWVFLAGAAFIFMVNAAGGSQEWGFLAGNTAEVVFMTCLLATERHFSH